MAEAKKPKSVYGQKRYLQGHRKEDVEHSYLQPAHAPTGAVPETLGRHQQPLRRDEGLLLDRSNSSD